MDIRKCIKCDTEIKAIDYGSKHHIKHPESAMWDGGIVDKITAGYGSSRDTDQFIIAICDKCIEHENIEHIGRISLGKSKLKQ